MAAVSQPIKPVMSWLPFAAAIAVPLTILAVMGAFSFEQTRHEATLRAQRASQTLTEHALRTFRAHDLIISAVDNHIEGWSWDDVERSRPLHDFFKSLIRNADDINTVFVIGPDGREGNSSLKFPLAPIDVTGRPFYEDLRRQDGLHISEPDVGRLNKQRYFSFTRRRSTHDGSFNGVISISVNPAYFETFYKTAVEGPEDSVGLIRSDGLLLVRVPSAATPDKQMLPSTPGGLMAAIRTSPIAGTFEMEASVDNVRRIYTYRRVGDFPLYVAYGLSYANVWAAWRRNMLAYSIICSVAVALLLLAAGLVRGHTRREAEASRRYADEAARRLAAEETSRSKDEFLAALSHELRNPLSAISAAVEILQRAHVDDPNGGHAVSIIGRQIDHLRRLLSDLLDVARSVHGKMSLEPQVVSVLDAAESVVAAYPGAVRKQVAVKVEGAPGWVRADPARLRQMIENLVDNSYKYGAHNLALDVAERDDMVVLTVSDDGDGIAPELLPKLFEPFVQGKQSIDRSRGGLGLGLALVHRLALAHGGSLHAASAGPGHGSTFVITLPKSDAPAPRPVVAPTAKASSGVRVLLIEDQPDARESLRILLELDDHQVETAADGSEGVTRFEIFAPDVVLVDIGLPGMNGYEVAHAIRAHENGKRAWLIALTGYGQQDDQQLAKKAGFDHHITKPVSYEALREHLTRQ